MPHSLPSRSALALAEAIIPGSAGSGSAGSGSAGSGSAGSGSAGSGGHASRRVLAADEKTVARAEEVISAFEPRLAAAWRAAHTVLDAAAVMRKGRPFHSLSADQQESLLRAWARDPILKLPLGLVSLVYRFVHFDRPGVYEAMGGTPNVVQRLEEPRWLRQ